MLQTRKRTKNVNIGVSFDCWLQLDSNHSISLSRYIHLNGIELLCAWMEKTHTNQALIFDSQQNRSFVRSFVCWFFRLCIQILNLFIHIVSCSQWWGHRNHVQIKLSQNEWEQNARASRNEIIQWNHVNLILSLGKLFSTLLLLLLLHSQIDSHCFAVQFQWQFISARFVKVSYHRYPLLPQSKTNKSIKWLRETREKQYRSHRLNELNT